MELNVTTLLLALVNLVAGLAVGVLLRKRLVEGNQKNIALMSIQYAGDNNDFMPPTYNDNYLNPAPNYRFLSVCR